jgi:hypothetical protein
MTYVMTKPCPVCKQQLTKKGANRNRPVRLRKACVPGVSIGQRRHYAASLKKTSLYIERAPSPGLCVVYLPAQLVDACCSCLILANVLIR